MRDATIDTPRPFRPSLTLLESKLRRPAQRVGIVERTHLVDRLAEPSGPRVISLVAPPGYGKTSLLAEWAARSDAPVAWLTLDDLDNDPTVLLSYLVTALDRIRPSTGRSRSASRVPSERVLAVAVPRLSSELFAVAGARADRPRRRAPDRGSGMPRRDHHPDRSPAAGVAGGDRGAFRARAPVRAVPRPARPPRDRPGGPRDGPPRGRCAHAPRRPPPRSGAAGAAGRADRGLGGRDLPRNPRRPARSARRAPTTRIVTRASTSPSTSARSSAGISTPRSPSSPGPRSWNRSPRASRRR